MSSVEAQGDVRINIITTDQCVRQPRRYGRCNSGLSLTSSAVSAMTMHQNAIVIKVNMYKACAWASRKRHHHTCTSTRRGPSQWDPVLKAAKMRGHTRAVQIHKSPSKSNAEHPRNAAVLTRVVFRIRTSKNRSPAISSSITSHTART